MVVLSMKLDSLLEKILEAKEKRVSKQEGLIEKYHAPLLSLSINIPGMNKQSDEAKFIFETTLDEIQKFPFKILEKIFTCNEAGYEAIFVFEAGARELKKFTCKVENTHPLGRFMDMDVIGLDKKSLSRKELGFEGRKCFLCQQDAKVCARSKAHSITELLAYISKSVNDYKTSL